MQPRRLVVAVALLAAACTSGDAADDDVESSDVELERPASPLEQLDAEPTPASTAPTQPADRPGEPIAAPAPTADLDEAAPDGVANDLVLVQDFASAIHLASYEPDGDLVAVYVADDGSLAWQPVWAPDGRSVAWASTTDATTWSLVVAATDGGDRTVYDLPGRPDYLTFDPTASRILAASPTPEGFGLVIVELGDRDDGGDDWTLLDVGEPYFSDFAPDGERLVGHLATDVRIVSRAGSVESLGTVTAGHQAPVWHPDGRRLLFTDENIDPATLVAYDLETGESSVIASFGTFVSFAVDPTGARVAVSTFDLNAGPGAVGATTEMRTGLWLVELADGRATRLNAAPTTAPLWDRTGTRLLVRDAAAGVGTWTVYALDGDALTSVRRDINTSLLPNYLPFWDQFVRSRTLWSPTGDRFVHVGSDEDGRSGVWIHDLAPDGGSTFLVEGELAFWSPT